MQLEENERPMTIATVPKLLDIPDKLLAMIEEFDSKRYWMLHGGRGGGKSQSVCRFILYLTDRYRLRVVCGREVQQNISESVYNLFGDLIQEHSLDFQVQATRIMSRATGSVISFRGFREAGKFGIQGIEGADLLFIDEAQALTKETLDVLIPTIRKENAHVIFSLNRYLVDDPVYVSFIGRSDCKTIHINFNENKFCPEALKREAEECRRLSEKDYRHIWLGQPLDTSEDGVFGVQELEASKKKDFPLQHGYGLRVAGFDIARYGDDKCAVVILGQRGLSHWQEIHAQEWEHRDLNFTTGKILQITKDFNISHAAIDEDGLGSGPLDTLTKGRGLDHFTGFRNTKISVERSKDYGNERTRYAYKLKDLVTKGHLALRSDKLISEMLSLKYTFDNNQRRILVSKDVMRKKGFKSPNLADAGIFAASCIFNTVKPNQERPFAVNHLPCREHETWNPFEADDFNFFA